MTLRFAESNPPFGTVSKDGLATMLDASLNQSAPCGVLVQEYVMTET